MSSQWLVSIKALYLHNKNIKNKALTIYDKQKDKTKQGGTVKNAQYQVSILANNHSICTLSARISEMKKHLFVFTLFF